MLFKIMTLVHLCVAFPLKCPEPAQWRLRANGHCADPSKYFCLRNDLINGYSENCTRSDLQQAGRKSVLRGGIDAVVCSKERYQPSQYIFYTNASTNCILLKSSCNEEGQVIYDQGDRNTDATCRCDYRQGYDFLVKTNNLCFCKPSQEDCSCILKICSNSSHILSPDYKCILKTDLPFVTQCRTLTNINDNNGRRPDVKENIPREKNISITAIHVIVSWRTVSAKAVLSIFSCTIGLFLLVHCMRKLKRYCFRVSDTFTSELNPNYIVEGERLHIKFSVYSEDIVVKWIKDSMEIEQNENLSIESYGKNRCMTVENVKLSDSGQYVMIAGNMKKQHTVTVRAMFTTECQPIHCIEGEQFELNCSVYSRDIHVEWFKDNNKIDQNETIVIERDGMNLLLGVQYAKLSDAGQYIVVAGNVRRQTTVTVKAMFSSEYNPIYCIEGEQLHLKCSVYSEDMYVEWFKDCTKIKQNENVSIKSEGRHHCLIIQHAKLSDAGQYVMVAGNVRKQLTVTVKAIFTSDFNPKSCIEGDELQLKCSVYSEDIDVEWFRDDKKIEQNENTMFERDGMHHYMTVQHAKLSDAGQYIMVACNVSKQITVTIKAMFTSEFNPIYCIEGEKLLLKCSVFSDTIHVEWLFKDNKKIIENENISIKSEGMHHCLIVQHAKLSDAGQYVMVAGNVRSQLTVKVQDRRELKEALEESLSSQRKAIYNWKLLKESLHPKTIIDLFISEGLVGKDLWDSIEHNSRRSQMDSILSNAIKNIETCDDYDKFEGIVVQCNSSIRLLTPNNDTILVYKMTEHRLRVNRVLVEKELYPKDYIDGFLEWFILSLADHEALRNKENVREKMAHSFLETIQQADYLKKGSMKCLTVSFERAHNKILKRLSELMDSALPNGISNFIADKNLKGLMEMRDACRYSILCNWTYLKKNFNPPNIIDELYNGGFVDEDRAEIIKEKPRREMVYSTLRNIVRRIDQPETLSELISILKRANLFFPEELKDIAARKPFAVSNEYDVEEVKRHLQNWQKDVEREFDINYIDTFLELNVFDIDDHEDIWEAAKDEKGKCFYEKISDIEYIKKGSFDRLVFCLDNSKDRKKIRQTLAKSLFYKQMPEQVKNRIEIHINPTREALYSKNTSTFTEGKLKMTVNDKETKNDLEDEIFEVAESSEDEEINGIKLKVTDVERSSVVLNLKSDDGDVKFIVEKGITNGDLTSFIRNLLDDEKIKMHMSLEKKYNISVSLHSKDKQKELYSVDQGHCKMRTLKANRDLLEEEYDPMLLLKAVFEENVKKYKSVENLSPESLAVFKHQFSEVNKEPERRERVKKFLDVAEDLLDADTLWDLIEDTANAFSVKKMRDDLHGLNSGRDDIDSVEDGLVFEGNYEVWITEEDVKSPLQSMMLAEREKKDTVSHKDLRGLKKFQSKQHGEVCQTKEIYLPRMTNTDEEPRSLRLIEKTKTNQGICDVKFTTEEENYVRMSLLLYGISSRAVRAFFDREFYPSCLYAFFKKAHKELNDLKKKRMINLTQWNLLFPRYGIPDSRNFDVTLMITLLTSLSPLIHYDTLPLITDTTPSADLGRIEYYRNQLSHNEDEKINNSFFSTAWNDIIEAVGRLGGNDLLVECHRLRTKSLEQSTTPWNTKEKIGQISDEWKMNKSSFIETRAAKHVLERVLENSCVTITASSGVGKTATLQYVFLKMVDKGYDVLPITNAHDIVRFNNPNQKTLFVMDDLCGTYSINLSDVNNLESLKERISQILKNKFTKIIVACRLQIYQDSKFDSLYIFRTCVCNLLSKDLCLLQTEKQSIAELYLETKASEIIQYCDLYDCFPLLCKLYRDQPKLNITDFFRNPFSVYESEVEKLQRKGKYGKYCALALCVMFNDWLDEKWMTDDIDKEKRTVIKNTCEACRLDRGTSRLLLLDELKSLEYTFVKKEKGVYKAIHDKVFDFLSSFFGQRMIQCVIKNANSWIISQRLLLHTQDDMDQFITVVPPKYHHKYIQRMVFDWEKQRVQHVFFNINMKIPECRERFLSYLNTLDISCQRQLALTCDFENKDTVLLHCCYLSDIPLINWCISHGVDVNQSNCKGVSPLIGSSFGSNTEVIEILLHNKADINLCGDSGVSPLITACSSGNTEIVRILLDNKADIEHCMQNGGFPLYVACEKNHIDVVKILLENKANINKCTPDGATPLFSACQKNHIDVVKLLLDNKADINKCMLDEVHPLLIACQNNHIEVVKVLLKNNADINKCTKNGVSPLLSACQQNHLELVNLLLENNADINRCTKDGVSPLFIACQNNHIEIVHLLLDNMADFEKCTNFGLSPLFIAHIKNHKEIEQLLRGRIEY